MFSYNSFLKTSVVPMIFLTNKEGLFVNDKLEGESPNFLIRTGAAFIYIPVATITFIAIGIISLLSLLPFAFLKMIGSEKQKNLKDIIHINDQVFLVGLLYTIGSIANLFTLTFYRQEIKKGLNNIHSAVRHSLLKIGFVKS